MRMSLLSKPLGDEPTIATLEDFAQSVNSRAEHFTSFCENSDPMLARTAAGCPPGVTQDRHSDRAGRCR